MHLKITVILCALYFFTVAKSTGLNEKQINVFVETIKKIKYSKVAGGDQIFRQMSVQLMLSLSYTDFNETFPYTIDINDKTAPGYLMDLAVMDKGTDDWKVKCFTSQEVNLFVIMFITADQKKKIPQGLLTQHMLRNLIDAQLKLETGIKEKIKKEFKDGELINAPKFLAAIVKHKPVGRGLNVEQVMKCIDLYNNHLDGDGCIKSEEIIKIYEKLNIVTNIYNYQVAFESKRPAALDVQELLIVLADYNNEESGVLSSKAVRDISWEFKKLDKNKDGVIGKPEIIKIVENLNLNVMDSIKTALDHDGAKPKNIAEFFLLILSALNRF
ncbi:uncharacterized protein LOC126836615 isoform X2 [Adelges cooleyi]|uniref:uncharacterized protein LOC126836615 isoform X2 n=1 Tax=Adelges cooleyi TaxID=133065 RepID=UPI0021806927|nr:uncharacterized protein LOC126836615 isoform X2 [Adelges cooleyi]